MEILLDKVCVNFLFLFSIFDRYFWKEGAWIIKAAAIKAPCLKQNTTSIRLRL